MKNITLAVEDTVLKRARIYAAEHETTVNALVRTYLQALASEKDRLAEQEARAAKARRELLELSDRSSARLGNWKWNREDIYRERLSRYEHIGLCGDGARPGRKKKAAGR